MKIKYLILLIIAFSMGNIFAQTDSLPIKKDITYLENQLTEQQRKLDDFYKELDKEYRTYKIIKKQFNDKYNIQEQTIDSLKQIINVNSANIEKTADELGVKIEDTHKFTSQSITDLNKTVSQNTLYWIIAILVIILFVLLVFILLRKQIFKQKTDLDSNLQEARKVLEEEGVKLDIKLAELLEKQLSIISEERKNPVTPTNEEVDHSLVLTIINRLTSMEKNLSYMDKKTQLFRLLNNSVQSIKDNLASNDYEIEVMIGKKYDSGMKAIVTYTDDCEEEENGKIVKIIKPQVNYKGQMIQSAEIVVCEKE